MGWTLELLEKLTPSKVVAEMLQLLNASQSREGKRVNAQNERRRNEKCSFFYVFLFLRAQVSSNAWHKVVWRRRRGTSDGHVIETRHQYPQNT